MLVRLIVLIVAIYVVYQLYLYTLEPSSMHVPRSPHYGLNYRFIDENCVGEGSCIYNPIDPGADGVLFDWGLLNQKYGRTLYRAPPLDPVEYEEAYRCCPT